MSETSTSTAAHMPNVCDSVLSWMRFFSLGFLLTNLHWLNFSSSRLFLAMTKYKATIFAQWDEKWMTQYEKDFIQIDNDMVGSVFARGFSSKFSQPKPPRGKMWFFFFPIAWTLFASVWKQGGYTPSFLSCRSDQRPAFCCFCHSLRYLWLQLALPSVQELTTRNLSEPKP